jgi:predicted cobalt transporter CbtA
LLCSPGVLTYEEVNHATQMQIAYGTSRRPLQNEAKEGWRHSEGVLLIQGYPDMPDPEFVRLAQSNDVEVRSPTDVRRKKGVFVADDVVLVLGLVLMLLGLGSMFLFHYANGYWWLFGGFLFFFMALRPMPPK